jgi:phytoene synthase
MSQTDDTACTAMLASGSRSFHAASRLLPRRVRRAATALYAFCRVADDAIDNAGADQDAALADLSARLDAIYAGAPRNFPEDRAFAAVVKQHFIPKELPAALLEGFAWDAQGRTYADFPALLEYAARVAGAVGAMMALVMGTRAQATIARACELGMAMQLSNIARDVGEDARQGRIYLPLDWLAEEGVDAADFLAQPIYYVGVQNVVARLLGEADLLYRQAASGIAQLPWDCRASINAARRLYEAIGHAAGEVAFDPVEHRAVVPARRKAMLVTRALVDTVVPAAAMRGVMPQAARALVQACMPLEATVETRKPIWRRAEARAVWMIELMAQIEERQQATAGRP